MNVPKQTQVMIKINTPGMGPGELTSFTVDGRVLIKGVFALHHPVVLPIGSRTLRQEGKSWTLTHLPTGMRVMQGIPTIKQGMAIANDLMAQGIDWDISDVKTWDPERRIHAKRIVQGLKDTYGLPR